MVYEYQPRRTMAHRINERTGALIGASVSTLSVGSALLFVHTNASLEERLVGGAAFIAFSTAYGALAGYVNRIVAIPLCEYGERKLYELGQRILKKQLIFPRSSLKQHSDPSNTAS